MSKAGILARLAFLVVAIGTCEGRDVRGEPAAGDDALVIRLVHPDRQAAALLRLFDGARVAHPAAALAAWKRATRAPDQLGKPLEAVIAMFNPEMAPEWKALHDAALHVNRLAGDGSARWYAVAPGDDGTLSAAITAMRLTEGATESPLAGELSGTTVERLGPGGSIFAARSGDTLILASTRDELLRGLRPIGNGSPRASMPGGRSAPERTAPAPGPGGPIDSGVCFALAPDRMNAGAGPVTSRRAAAFLQSLGCRRMTGTLALKDDRCELEVTTLLRTEGPVSPLVPESPAEVEPSWLTWVPARNVMGVVSLALKPGAAFWESAFKVADRVDRADPARAGLAPLRTRLNLVAAAAGARPEIDLWPHLRGVTACVMVDPDRPGQSGDALLVLHTDGDASARRLATDVVPRLASLSTGARTGPGLSRKIAPGHRPTASPEGEASRLGTVGGRSLTVLRRGRDVVVAWGDQVLNASRAAMADPEQSVVPLCTGWLRERKPAPQRLGAVWPARSWSGPRGLDRTAPAWQALVQGPPVIWWGWTNPAGAIDSIQYSNLRRLARDFLDKLPLAPSPLP